MKLLFDNNLSTKLPGLVIVEFPGSVHVSSVGLHRADDRSIWSYAKQHDFTILTKDKDFYYMSRAFGQPPKVVWILRGNMRNNDMIAMIQGRLNTIKQFLASDRALLPLL